MQALEDHVAGCVEHVLQRVPPSEPRTSSRSWLSQSEPADQRAAFRALIDEVIHEMHRDGRIVAALGHGVALIVEGELQPCSA